MMRLKGIAGVLLVVVLLGLFGCSGGSGASSGGGGGSSGGAATGGTTVVEKGLAFNPASLEVKVGDTVTFSNEDSAPHNVKIDGKELGTQDPGASVTWKAEKAGSFPYSCTIHPSMTGQITVK